MIYRMARRRTCPFLWMWAIIFFIWVLLNISAFTYPIDKWVTANGPEVKRDANISGTRHSSDQSGTSRKPSPSPSGSSSAPSPQFKILRPKPPEAEEKKDFGTSCTCRTAPLAQWHVYEEQLSLPIPQLNMTSGQVLARRHPNFPHSLVANAGQEWCHLLPPPHTIEWKNANYQSVTVANTTYQLYSAFLDNRPLTNGRPCIRILAYTMNKKPSAPWCYIWSNSSGPPAISQVKKIEYVDPLANSSNRVLFYILTCRIPKAATRPPPLAVSVVRRPCDKAETLLQINGAMQRNTSTAYVKGSKPKRKSRNPLWNVAVCGPALFYYHDDISIRLVEWFELLRAMGFARVFLLQTQVHPNIEKVLRYYEAEGFTSVTKFSYPGPYANEPNIRRLWVLLERRKLFAMENMYFTDCLLRHMHEYRFISHFDPDEMPMLPNHDSFPRWLYSRIQRTMNYSRRPTSYDLSWRYHHDDLEPNEDESLPEYLWFLRHTRRANIDVYKSLKKPTYDMDVVTGVFSHGAVTCVYGKCLRKANKCPRKVAYLGHYRRDCGEKCLKPGAVANESSLLQYKDTVASAVKRVLVELELI